MSQFWNRTNATWAFSAASGFGFIGNPITAIIQIVLSLIFIIFYASILGLSNNMAKTATYITTGVISTVATYYIFDMAITAILAWKNKAS